MATTFHGDGKALKSTLPRSVGIVTQSAQLAAQISGAFTSGFILEGTISGSSASLLKIQELNLAEYQLLFQKLNQLQLEDY